MTDRRRQVFEELLANAELDTTDKLLGQTLLLGVLQPRALFERLCERAPECGLQPALEEVLREAGAVPFSLKCFDVGETETNGAGGV